MRVLGVRLNNPELRQKLLQWIEAQNEQTIWEPCNSR